MIDNLGMHTYRQASEKIYMRPACVSKRSSCPYVSENQYSVFYSRVSDTEFTKSAAVIPLSMSARSIDMN